MSNDPRGNHGEGDPAAAARFNKAETRFVGSVRGTEAIREGADVRPEEESELEEAEQLGNARAKGLDGTTPVVGSRER